MLSLHEFARINKEKLYLMDVYGKTYSINIIKNKIKDNNESIENNVDLIEETFNVEDLNVHNQFTEDCAKITGDITSSLAAKEYAATLAGNVANCSLREEDLDGNKINNSSSSQLKAKRDGKLNLMNLQDLSDRLKENDEKCNIQMEIEKDKMVQLSHCQMETKAEKEKIVQNSNCQNSNCQISNKKGKKKIVQISNEEEEKIEEIQNSNCQNSNCQISNKKGKKKIVQISNEEEEKIEEIQNYPKLEKKSLFLKLLFEIEKNISCKGERIVNHFKQYRIGHISELYSSCGIYYFKNNEIYYVNDSVIKKIDTFTLPGKIVYFKYKYDNIFVMDEQNNVYVRGLNKHGQLGFGDKLPRINGFIPFNFEKKVVQISCNEFQTFVLDSYGDVYGIGINEDGSLGVGDRVDRMNPDKLVVNDKIVKVATGSSNTLLLSEKHVYFFGDNVGTNCVGDKNYSKYVPIENSNGIYTLLVDSSKNIVAVGNNNNLISLRLNEYFDVTTDKEIPNTVYENEMGNIIDNNCVEYKFHSKFKLHKCWLPINIHMKNIVDIACTDHHNILVSRSGRVFWSNLYHTFVGINKLILHRKLPSLIRCCIDRVKKLEENELSVLPKDIIKYIKE